MTPSTEHDPDHATPPRDERRSIRNIDLRRAVLRILLERDEAVSLDEIVERLEVIERIAIAEFLAVSARQRISDLLRWQIHEGRVRRIRRGWYQADPSRFSRTTRWRIMNWERVRELR